MKSVSLVLNIVLFVAVGILYYLHFSGPESATSQNGGAATMSPEDMKIAFVRSDTLVKRYTYLEDIQKQFEDKSKKLDQEYRNRAQGLQNEFNEYQRNVGNLTLSQARAVEENLTKKEQNLRLYEQSLSQELANEQARIQKELYDRVTAFLKSYGQEKGFTVVLKFDPTSDVLFAGDSLDITEEVVAGLNLQYDKEKADAQSATKAKADSVAKKK